MSDDLKVYKLIKENDYASEYGWQGKNFFVWIPFYMLDDFMKELIEIVGVDCFADGGFDVNLQDKQICIELKEILEWGTAVDLEEIFPKEEY